ncbi:hypothetical protein LDB30_06100 [Acidithiobacillus ferrooxidans]|jgi:hypothetical protein|nr:hypothetical protein LDB30_06100 [Acidithiobacillus ferrooxidans]
MLINGIEYDGEITEIPASDKPFASSVLAGFILHVFAKGKRDTIQVESFRAMHGRYPEKGEKDETE